MPMRIVMTILGKLRTAIEPIILVHPAIDFAIIEYRIIPLTDYVHFTIWLVPL
jgi:hypothetical protein